MPEIKQIKSAGLPPRRLWVRVLKAVLLTLWGILLFVAGILICTVTILTPERLTPIVSHVATSQLRNAHVEAGRVELSLRATFPFLQLDISDLSVLSSAVDSLAPQARSNTPQWADTVLHIHHFSGGVNLAALALNTIELSDVTITRPSVNYVVVNDSVTNFDILPAQTPQQPEKPFDWNAIPRIRMRRFTVDAPTPVRYLDVSTGTLITANIEHAGIDGNARPLYRLRFDGNVKSPLLMKYWTLPQVTFGLAGSITWDQATPQIFQVDDMQVHAAVVDGTLSARIDMTDGLRLNALDIEVRPIGVNRVLDRLPADFKAAYGIPEGIETDATVALRASLTQPFRVGGTSALPHCRVSVDIPDASFYWRRVHFDNLAADIDVTVPGDSLNDITVKINRLNMRGPATDLDLTGTVTSLMDDPLFDGTVRGSCELSKLPPVLTAYIPGFLRGHLTADATVKGRPSMFALDGYHRLKVTGQIAVSQLYYISRDTTGIVYASRAAFDFGTPGGHGADSLLHARITIDSATVLNNDISMRLGRLRFGFGSVAATSSFGAGARERRVVPMGGALSIGSFRLTLLSDSLMTNVRQLSGQAAIMSHGGDTRIPELRFNLDIKRFSAGDRTKRVMFRDAHCDLTAWPEPQTRGEKRVRRICDSLMQVHPGLSPDTVYDMALAISRAGRQSRATRPSGGTDSLDIIDFGNDNSMRRLLLGWSFGGSLTASRAGVFTPYFPLRNRFRNINLHFSNDSVVMRDVRYKCGQSDFTMSGVIANIKRALTSRRGRQPLRVDLDLASDTININQLAQTAFAGSAYQQAILRDSTDAVNLSLDDDEAGLDKEIGIQVPDADEAMAPLLIPVNVQANLNVRANNVLYSDMLLHDMTGKAMTYQGALSLNNLSARSDFGDVSLQALYVGRMADSLQFGFGMQVRDFNISRFLRLMPALDTIMPLLKDFGGIIDADIAATTDITRTMDFDMPSMRAAIQLTGDSLVLLDPDTFKSLSKWLMFKNKQKNYIDHMSVQMLVENGRMQLFPFIFNIDRYKLGVQGANDFNLNFKYHIAVLKSPIPFKFGINISGNPDDYKIRLGGAKFDEKTPVSIDIVDTTRINLVNSLRDVFRRGVAGARFSKLKVSGVSEAASINLDHDSLSHADSLQFIREGLIPAPDSLRATPAAKVTETSAAGPGSRRSGDKGAVAPALLLAAVLRPGVNRRTRKNVK